MIKFVYFDIGGVVILDFSETDEFIKMRRAMGVTPEKDALFDEIWQHTRNRINIDVDVDTLQPVFEKELGITLPKSYSMLSDFVRRFKVNSSIWPVMNEIHRKCKVGLLTNMYPRMLGEIQRSGIFPKDHWDAIVDSSVVGYQKPQREIFEIAQKSAFVSAEEILFIDNQAKNTEAASKLGWNAFLYDTKDPKQASADLLNFFNSLQTS